MKNLVVLVTAAAYFAATDLGQQTKLRILTEKLLVISQRFFGIPANASAIAQRRTENAATHELTLSSFASPS